jgi:hypothetical protein
MCVRGQPQLHSETLSQKTKVQINVPHGNRHKGPPGNQTPAIWKRDTLSMHFLLGCWLSGQASALAREQPYVPAKLF